MDEDHEHGPEPTAWSKLPWANMSEDQVKANLAAMEADFQARRPEVEARLVKQERQRRERRACTAGGRT